MGIPRFRKDMSFDREEREMHTTTCGDCGNECQVPFKPKEDRPVYCNVSKTINQPQEKVAVDLAEDLAVEDLVATEALDLVVETTDHVKCMMQNVVTVVMTVKYHSNQKKTDLFIAETVSKTTKIRTTVLSNFQNSFIL
jgi:CxxC-x17-CxxC domain-containing protein